MRTHYERDTVKPGMEAFDIVAHCGGSASGQFCKTLTGTDVYSGRIEERALLNVANSGVKATIADIQAALAFPVTGAHDDKGIELINEPLLAWCIPWHIEPRRTRPYHKNDKCFAEQKNYDAVRKTVGYFRFDTAQACAALVEVYRFLCPLYNYWIPSFRLGVKEKQEEGCFRKVYEKSPRTLYEWLMESAAVSPECKGELGRRRAEYNPVELNGRLNEAVGQLLKINREKMYDKKTFCQGDSQASAV